MLVDILLSAIFAALIIWSTSLQITLQAVSEKRIRIIIISIITCCLFLAGLISTLS